VVSTLALLSAVAGTARVARAQDVQCDEGEREVRGLHFTGNTTFTDDDLSARVATTPSSGMRRLLRVVGAKRCLPTGGLSPDVFNVTQWYRNNGFFDVRVDTAVKSLPGPAIDVTFKISEGQPLILDSLRIEGLDSVPDRDRIVEGLQLKLGGRFGVLLMLTDVDSIIDRLRNHGYPQVDVFRSYKTHTAEHLAEVDLDVTTGVRARFGTIAINSVNQRGEKPATIDSAVVLRLLGFRSGDVYTDRALSDAQRTLYSLGTYQHVGIVLDTTAQQSDSLANVLIDLREGQMHQVDLEEGWATLDCFRLNSRYVDKNFRGEAQQLELNGSLSKLGYAEHARSSFTRNLCNRSALDADSISSQKVNGRLGATLRQGNVLGSRWAPSYSAYTERRGEYQAYLRSTDFGFSVTAAREISRRMPLQLGYTFEHGATRAENAVLCGVFARCDPESQDEVQRRLLFGVASASLQRTTTDNSVAPTRGYNAAVELRYSAPWLASDPTLRFFKVTADGAWYHQLASRITLAAGIRAGFIQGGAESNNTKLPPPQERLYAGGAYSVRGFQQNELGPQVYLLDTAAFRVDTVGMNAQGDQLLNYIAKPGSRPFRSVPVGGNTSLVMNAELRLRDPFLPDALEYIPFIDAGQVWTRQIATPQFNLEQLDYTPGLAVRYFSPIGPIQMNVGYNRYGSRAGRAFFPAPVDPRTNKAPLICVTAPGVTPLVVTNRNGELLQDLAACPNSYVPRQPSSFFSHLTWTFSINAEF
jgi:outer membrane protein assembly complex protein YaeT